MAAVANGAEVTAGQVVGAIGAIGATGGVPHVHFEVVRRFRTPAPAICPARRTSIARRDPRLGARYRARP